MLIDTVKIKIQSGDGGHGSMSTRANRAFGGDAGNGGSIIFRGDANMPDLYKYSIIDSYKAERGFDGMKNNLKGSNGKDLIVEVPLTTEIYSRGELITKIDKHGLEVTVLTGGTGALGNMTLKRKQHNNPDSGTIESCRQGKSIWVELVLKLKSDVIFIGYPNAGKSSMLNQLTNANAKTASYAFTTLEPQVGMMEGLVLMDLPGLIDGTYVGKGLGTKFVKHTENSKLMAHFVSLENPDPFKTYQLLRAEIQKISKTLFNMDEIVLLAKSDEVAKDKLEKVVNEFKKANIKVIPCSIIDDDSIKAVRKEILMRLKPSKVDKA
jgi:GTP-binding protein